MYFVIRSHRSASQVCSVLNQSNNLLITDLILELSQNNVVSCNLSVLTPCSKSSLTFLDKPHNLEVVVALVYLILINL